MIACISKMADRDSPERDGGWQSRPSLVFPPSPSIVRPRHWSRVDPKDTACSPYTGDRPTSRGRRVAHGGGALRQAPVGCDLSVGKCSTGAPASAPSLRVRPRGSATQHFGRVSANPRLVPKLTRGDDTHRRRLG